MVPLNRRGVGLMLAAGLALSSASCSVGGGAPASGGPATPNSTLDASAPTADPTSTGSTPSIAPPPGTPATSNQPLAITDTVVIDQGQPGTVLEMKIPITDNAAVNDVLMSWATVRRSSFVSAAQFALSQAPAPPPPPAPPETAPGAAPATTVPAPPAEPVVPRLSVAVDPPDPGAVAGILRLRAEEDLGTDRTVSRLALYRLPDSTVIFGTGLIDPAQRQPLVDLVRSRVDADATGAAGWWSPVWPGAVFGSVLSDLQLGVDGSLTATIEPHLLASATEAATIRLTPEEAAPFLSGNARWLLGDDQSAPGADADCAVDRCVTLTFDDGPSPDTPRLLTVLEHAKVRSTFFMIGLSVQKRPAIAKAVADAGHEIGNHTWSHPQLGDLELPDQQREVFSAEYAISAATGATASLLRPPAGAYDDGTRNLGFGVALWNVDTKDWQHKDPARTVERALLDTVPGSIVLMHDLHASTVDSTALIIAGLRSDGYRFMTMTELVGASVPGSLYYALGRIEPLSPPPAPPPTTAQPAPAGSPAPVPQPTVVTTAPPAPAEPTVAK